MTAWGKKNVFNYYNLNRDKIDDLYKSEKKLLDLINKKDIKSILDYGCATGNFYKIFQKYFGKINYLGIDQEQILIKKARKKYKATFIVNNKLNQKIIKNRKFDLTFCTSVLHHIKNYKNIIRNLIKSSSSYIFIDSPRIHLGKFSVLKMNLSERFKSNQKKNIVKYYVENIKKYLNFLKKEFKKNNIKEVVFYVGELKYSDEYLNFDNKIFFLTILIKKNNNFKNYNTKISYKIIANNKRLKNIFFKVLE